MQAIRLRTDYLNESLGLGSPYRVGTGFLSTVFILLVLTEAGELEMAY